VRVRKGVGFDQGLASGAGPEVNRAVDRQFDQVR